MKRSGSLRRAKISADGQGVVSQERVQADECALVAAQVLRKHRCREWQVGSSPAIHALAPATGHGRHPAGCAGARVLPADGMHVCASAEEISVEAKLLLDRGCRGDETVAAERCGELLLARFRLAGA